VSQRPVGIDARTGKIDERKPRERLERGARLHLAALHAFEQFEHPFAVHRSSRLRTVSQGARSG
jgi:hypothetical protein